MRKLTLIQMVCAAIALCALTAPQLSAQTYKTLVNFDIKNGNIPDGALVQGFDGYLYGTTYDGGSYRCDYCGIFFKISSEGLLTVIYRFQGGLDGKFPIGALTLGTDGNLYGATSSGGIHDGGTIFKVTPEGTLKTIYAFCSKNACSDGSFATGGLVVGTDGNFYGTTVTGGLWNAIGGYGTVFRITSSGVLTTLHTFSGRGDGGNPYGLSLGADGNFYGTTYQGGNSRLCDPFGCGTVFSITPAGKLTTIYNFCSQPQCVDGMAPFAPPIQATDWNLYGTTDAGGAGEGLGTVYRITLQGSETTLYSFCSRTDCADGSSPAAPLMQATDGNLYGAASGVAATFDTPGSLFKITTAGEFTGLHEFEFGGPSTPVIQSTNGNFYGTSLFGGTGCPPVGCGIVYSESMGLAPFVETLPTGARVGDKIFILGNNLTGASSVTFNGIEATSVTVLSDTHMSAIVPSSATTGPVVVTTPTGTLTSNVNFRIVQ